MPLSGAFLLDLSPVPRVAASPWLSNLSGNRFQLSVDLKRGDAALA